MADLMKTSEIIKDKGTIATTPKLVLKNGHFSPKYLNINLQLDTQNSNIR